jgi:hypothetical protein
MVVLRFLKIHRQHGLNVYWEGSNLESGSRHEILCLKSNNPQTLMSPQPPNPFGVVQSFELFANDPKIIISSL